MSVLGMDDVINAFPDPTDNDHVSYNPSRAKLRSWSSHLESPTSFGAPAYHSDVKSRSADRTKNAIDHRFTSDDWDAIRDAIAYVHDPANDLVCVDRQIGTHSAVTYQCRLFVPREFARIALAWRTLLDPTPGHEPDFITVQLPEQDTVAVRILPESGITCVLGSDYTGEAKKSFLRLFMYRAKQQGGLGLHAGAKRVQVCRNGELRSIGQLFLGLSATGKTTLTCHDFGLPEPESTTMIQDDVCALLPNGTVAGSEGGGLYIKTLDLSPEHSPLYDAATQSHAILENVVTSEDGSVNFSDDAHTANIRGVIRREDLDSAAETINLDRVDQIFFITRNPLMPPIGKLNAEQAAAAFMLGESIETSAGDPDRAGTAVRVVGTNPFIVGSPGKEGNRFYSLVSELDVDCYLLNTGQVGREGPDIGVEDSVSIVRAVARGEIEWRWDERLGIRLPRRVDGIDIDSLYPPEYVDKFDEKFEQLRNERHRYLAQFDHLDTSIEDAAGLRSEPPDRR